MVQSLRSIESPFLDQALNNHAAIHTISIPSGKLTLTEQNHLFLDKSTN